MLMKKPNNFTTTKNQIGMTLLEYNNLRRFSCGISCIVFQYSFWQQNKHKKLGIHFTLMKPELKQIFEKERIGMIFNKLQLPYKDVEFSALKPTRTADNPTMFKQVINNLPKMLDKPIILNLHSEIGEQANLCACYMTEQLLKITKGKSTNGVALNQVSTDFSESNAIEDLLSADFLTIFGINTVYATDYRKAFVNNLYEYAKLNNKPIIISNNVELKLPQFKVINLRLSDKQKNVQELITEIFGTEENPKIPEIN